MVFFKKLLIVISLLVVNGLSYANDFVVRIAIIDVEQILGESVAVKGINKVIEKISTNITKDLTKKEAEILDLEQKLKEKQQAIGRENKEIEKDTSDFYKKVNEAQHEVRQKKLKLEKAHSDAIRKVQQTILEIITSMSKEYGFNLVVPSSQILYASDNLNITPVVIARLNKKLKFVNVNY